MAIGCPTGVLFVCLGNICRSPTAEAVFRVACEREGLAPQVEIDSAGTGDWHVGRPPDERAIAHGAQRGYDLTPLRARQVTAADFDRFQWILAMDVDNLADLSEMRPAHYTGYLGLFLDFAADVPEREVPDPYDEGPEAFEHMIDLIEVASAALASRLAHHTRDPR
jgi:protein-tyrosine phosphatase